MAATVYAALFGWSIVTIGLFALLPPHRAVIACIVGGYMFLPAVGITLVDGVPPWTANASLSWFTLGCAFAFAPRPILTYRFHWFDALVAAGLTVWGISPLVNSLGIQQSVLDWWWYLNWAGIPYFLGRCYLNGPMAIRDLAVGIAAGVLLYSPLVLFEARFYPNLNSWLYEFRPKSARNVHRWGGFRPSVFLPTGLALALWMCLGAVVAWALWLSGASRRILAVPTAVAVALLSLTAVAAKGAGALILAAAGVGALLAVHKLRALWVLHLVPLFVLAYLLTGVVVSNIPIRDVMLRGVEYLPGILGTDERIGSLRFRFDHEEVLAQRTRERPVWGLGGCGRSRIEAELAKELLGRREVVTDGFWIVAFGDRGLVGLVTTYGWMLMPGALAMLQLRRMQAPRGIVIIVSGLYLWATLYAADLLLNGFVSPVQGLVAGGLAAFVMQGRRRLPRSARGSGGMHSVPPVETRNRIDPDSPAIRSPVHVGNNAR